MPVCAPSRRTVAAVAAVFILRVCCVIHIPPLPSSVNYVWSLAYVFFPSFMEKTIHIPSFAAMTVSELILTFLLLFVHLKFLRNTWLNKIPMVFAGITTVFIGGIDHIALSGLSTFMGISMAVLTEIIIIFLTVINKEKQVEQ